MIEEIFFTMDAVREIFFGAVFTVLAFLVGRESGARRQRMARRSFMKQLISLQTAVNSTANETKFWTDGEVDTEAVFSPFISLMAIILQTAGDNDVSHGNYELEAALAEYERAFNAFIEKRAEAKYQAKTYRDLNDQMVEALIGVAKTFDWRVRWGLMSGLNKLKFGKKGFLAGVSMFSQSA